MKPITLFYEFRKGETIEILSHKHGGGRGGCLCVCGGGGGYTISCGGKLERCERLVCLCSVLGFFFFLAPSSQIRITFAPAERIWGSSGIHGLHFHKRDTSLCLLASHTIPL